MHPSKKIIGSKGDWLKGKTIALAITGSIAAVKTFRLSRELMRHGAEVHVVMSESAKRLVSAEAMHYATGNPVIEKITAECEYLQFMDYEGKADLLLIAPCTASTLGKIAYGIDDSTVTAFALTALGSRKKIAIVPSMHLAMYENPIVKENLGKLKGLGAGTTEIIEPRIEEGKAKFPKISEIVLRIERILGNGKLNGKKFLVTSGKTVEEIDPIRILTSKASGITGREIARELFRQGADVTIIHNGKIEGCIKSVYVESADDMKRAVMAELGKGDDSRLEKDYGSGLKMGHGSNLEKNSGVGKGYDYFISAAAVGDFRVKKAMDKIKSDKAQILELIPNGKIIEAVRKKFPGQKIVAFKAETNVSENELIEIARKRMKELDLDIIVGNDIAEKGIGMPENEVIFMDKKGKLKKVKGRKSEIAKGLIGLIEGI